MAKAAKRRVNQRTERNRQYAAATGYSRTGQQRSASVYGGAVARGGTARSRNRVSSPAAAERGTVSVRTKKNRARALALSRGFVIFLAIILAATVFMCVRFLRLKTAIRQQTRATAAMQSELSTLRAENDALYADILHSVNLDEVRRIATEEYGMNYAEENQVIWYNTSGSGYVRQYKEVP